MVRKNSDRLIERAMARFNKAMNENAEEPVNEAIRGREVFWKLPCKEYHIPCRQGKPR